MRLYSLIILAISLSIVDVSASETISEKAEATAKDIKRDANEAVNRVKEAACTGNDAECAKQKIEHRLEETKDAVKDKSSEAINKIN